MSHYDRIHERLSKGLPPWMSISFSMGGWLQFYLYGVARAIQAKGLDKGVRYCGCSAGALTAAGLAVDADFDYYAAYARDNCLHRAYSNLSGLFRMSQYVEECLDITHNMATAVMETIVDQTCDLDHDSESKEMPLDTVNINQLLQSSKFISSESQIINGWRRIESGVLNVATTKLPFLEPERISSFENYNDFKSALLASCAAFPFGSLVKRKGHWCIDGCVSDLQPVIDDDTVTVSTFYFSNADIKPSRYVPLWWICLPPNPETIDWLYCLGWDDGIKYFEKCGIPMKDGNGKYGDIKRPSHPFDMPRQVTMYRLFGYEYTNISTNLMILLADLALLMAYIVIFKPCILAMIYYELFIRSIIYAYFAIISVSCRSVLTEAYTKSKVSVTNSYDTKEYSKMFWDCVSCIVSLSLLLRFLSLRPSKTELRKYKRLERLSFFYRIFRHII